MRYTGPVCRLCRREGVKLFLKGDKCFTKCVLEKRKGIPGQHVKAYQSRKASEYHKRLREKQKLRRMIGLGESSFRRYFAHAAKRPGLTGEYLLRSLETRLDNVTQRLGFAISKVAARQIVLHGHITMNNRKTNVPSAHAKLGDAIGWSAAGRATEYFKVVSHTVESKAVPQWLDLNRNQMMGRVLSIPARSDMDSHVNEQAIVEFYSR